MKQTLQLRSSQHLALTPQLQQSIRLLQLSTLELQRELEQILSDNPLLERLDNPLEHSHQLLPDGAITRSESNATEDGLHTEYLPYQWSSSSSPHHSIDDDNTWQQLAAQQSTLQEHLQQQLRETLSGKRDHALVELIISALNDNGYLAETLEEIHARLPATLEVAIEELSIALKMLQSFEPAGIGARDAAECLSLQINRVSNISFEIRQLALTIVQKHLSLFAQRDFVKIKKILTCDDQNLRAAQSIIKHCNPYPGAIFNTNSPDYITPDVIVKRGQHGWQVSLNQEVVPRLQINILYASILKKNKSDGALITQLQEAKWLVKNIKQRFDTILRVAQAIVECQKNFFAYGAVAMRPLVLREIADTLGLHESTISRVTTQKYMLTPYGMFELKYFFGSHVATEAGGEASSTAIRALIRQLIGAEDTKNPFSDNKIAEMLAEQGMVIARRTVAKYREALKIPPVNLRKTL